MNFNGNILRTMEKVKSISSELVYETLDSMENKARRLSDENNNRPDARDNYCNLANGISELKQHFKKLETEKDGIKVLQDGSGLDFYNNKRNRRIALTIEYLLSGQCSSNGIELAKIILLNSPISVDDNTDLPAMKNRQEAYTAFLESKRQVLDWRGKPSRDLMGNIIYEWNRLSIVDMEYIYKLIVNCEANRCIPDDHPLYDLYDDSNSKIFHYIMLLGKEYSAYNQSDILKGNYTEKIATTELYLWANILDIDLNDTVE